MQASAMGYRAAGMELDKARHESALVCVDVVMIFPC